MCLFLAWSCREAQRIEYVGWYELMHSRAWDRGVVAQLIQENQNVKHFSWHLLYLVICVTEHLLQVTANKLTNI